MTELCIYQLEDIVWDDFCQSDDHGVPNFGGVQASEHSFHGNSLKRAREEASCVASDAGDLFAEEPIRREKEEMETLTAYNGQNKMLEKEDWSQKSDGVVHSSCNDDSIKEASSLVSGGTRRSNKRFQISEGSRGSELCDNDSTLSDQSAAVGDSFGHPLDCVSRADNDLTFFGNNCEDRDCNDFLYYGWPDIGNFEDVDRMFRICDSAFALGARNEDDVGWYSSSDAFGGSKFSCPESSALESVDRIHVDSRLNGTSGSIKKSSMHNSSDICKGNSSSSVEDESGSLGHLSFPNGSNCSDNKDGQFDEEKQLKHNNQAELSNNDHQYSENCSSFYVDDMSESVRQQKRESDSNDYEYLQSDTHLSLDDCHPSDQTSMDPTLSAVKSENSSLTLLSSKDSYTLKQVQAKEGISFQGTSDALIEKRENPHQNRCFQASFNNDFKNMDLAISVTTSMENLVSCPGDKFKNHADDDVDMEIARGFGSSIKQEKSSMSSGLDDVSKEATSFCQFQLVIDRLDSRTKLCIRDSLYRLAWSAEQRHNSLKLNGGNSDGRDANGVLLTEGTNMYTDFMDMESETNPIDRSMAHLLFHRAGDSSVMPGRDSVSFTSPIQASF